MCNPILYHGKNVHVVNMHAENVCAQNTPPKNAYTDSEYNIMYNICSLYTLKTLCLLF